MEKKIFVILLFFAINVIKISSCNNCDINVDSLFLTNLSILKQATPDSTGYVTIQGRDNLEFLFVVSSLSGKDAFENVYIHKISTTKILFIEDWYKNKKKYITCEKVKKAYSLLYPPMFNTFEDFERFEKELDELEIKDE